MTKISNGSMYGNQICVQQIVAKVHTLTETKTNLKKMSL